MLLLHEFHDKKFLLPDKLSNKVGVVHWRGALCLRSMLSEVLGPMDLPSPSMLLQCTATLT